MRVTVEEIGRGNLASRESGPGAPGRPPGECINNCGRKLGHRYGPDTAKSCLRKGGKLARTDDERFKEAILYLSGVDLQLSDDVSRKIANKTLAGQEISLGGAGYWHSGTPEQHAAVRAYLLCLIAYLRAPHAHQINTTGADLDRVRTNLRGRSVQQVNQQIRLFTRKPGASLGDLVDAANRISKPIGAVDVLARTREDDNVGANPVCYNGVKTWLFAAGFVSKRWLAKEGQTLDGNCANRFLGDGQVVAQHEWDSIPRGYMWNIHKKNDPTTCHWGVSLGNNVAVACNNTDGSVGPDKALVMLKYEPNTNTAYGKFEFTNICEVCNWNVKYQGAGGVNDPSGINIVVRKIDPMTVMSFY